MIKCVDVWLNTVQTIIIYGLINWAYDPINGCKGSRVYGRDAL